MSRRKLLLFRDDTTDADIAFDALIESHHKGQQTAWLTRVSQALRRLTGGGRDRSERMAAAVMDLFSSDGKRIKTFDHLFRAPPQRAEPVANIEDAELARLAALRRAQEHLLKNRPIGDLLPRNRGGTIERSVGMATRFDVREAALSTLDSLGRAVISVDARGQVSYLNEVAELLTGWSWAEAAGHPLEEVFRIIDATTRLAMPNSMMLAIEGNKVMGLSPNATLIRRDGLEFAIEDSSAPIHDRQGQVTGAVVVFHDVSAARTASQRMSYLAEHDSLTDLPNRSLLTEHLTRAIAVAALRRQRFTVFYLALDRFKQVNDSLGHAIGDSLLQSVAQRLLACVRPSDTVSRQGGDEFVILLPELSATAEIIVFAETLLAAIGAPHRIGANELFITTSIGIAMYPEDGTDAAALIENADFAMYHVKDAGIGSYRFFHRDMTARAIERRSIEDGLRNGLGKHEFVLHYQPIVNLKTNSITGVEALIRWHHPYQGFMGPTQFVSIAEECGLIVPIGRWVLREACRQARSWREAGLPALSIAINVSSVELRAAGFVSGVRAVLAETGVDPHCLEFELTETFLMEDSKLTEAVLTDLKSIGIQLALDDFGTGYSSLSYLKRFPIDTLKIDRSFVSDLDTNGDDAGIVRAVINMGESLHMRVVAEGVETREQLALLQAHGCPFAQGYYFSPPVAAAEFAQLLAAGGANWQQAPRAQYRLPKRKQRGN